MPLAWVVREGIRVIRLSSSKQNYKNNSCTQFAREDVDLWPFYNSHVQKRKLFTRKSFQTILKNQLGFITTSAIKLCFMQREGCYSLTFINFQENYQTAEISFHSYRVIPLYKTICNYLSTSFFQINTFP